MTEEEILGPGIDLDDPFGGGEREYLGDRYPVCLGSSPKAQAETLGVIVEDGPPRECWIDLQARRPHHMPGCRCLRRLT